MKNKTVIRKPNEHGSFTTIHHSILFDTRLSALELRILVCILSDSDNFNLTQNLLINRLGITKKTLQKAFKSLEDCGYMRRTELKKGHYYTISEYGNLSEGNPKSEIITAINIEEKIIESTANDDTPTSSIVLTDYNHLIADVLPPNTSDEEIFKLMSYLTMAVKEGRLLRPEQMTTSNLKKVVNKLIPRQGLSSKDINFIIDICNLHADGRGITIAKKKSITDKVLKYFTENTDLKITEKAVRGRILFYKTSYTNHGFLDQRYQN